MKLNIELENLKTEVKTLKQIDINESSTIQDINKVSHSCKCCDKFKVETKDLKDSLAKFTLGKNNLDIILGKQICVFDKAGLGYRPEKQHKMYKNLFILKDTMTSPSSIHLLLTTTYLAITNS